MTPVEIEEKIRPYLASNPEGCFNCGEFDLDVRLSDWKGLTLWLDGDHYVEFDLAPCAENARLVQQACRILGREVIHTWNMSYSTELGV